MNGYAQSSSFETLEGTAAILKALKVRFLTFFAAMFIFYYAIFSYFSFGLVLFGIKYYFYYILASSFTLSILAALSIAIGLYSQKTVRNNVKGNRSDLDKAALPLLKWSRPFCKDEECSLAVEIDGHLSKSHISK